MSGLNTISETARCLDCGYLLRNLPTNICPECGTRFDPFNRDSYNDPARDDEAARVAKRRLIRMSIAPPGPITIVLLMVLFAARLPMALSFESWIAFSRDPPIYVLLILAILSMLQIVIGTLVQRRLDPAIYPAWPNQSAIRRVMFILFLLVLVLGSRPWIAEIRFHASRAALETEIAGAMRIGSAAPFRRIGALDVEYIHLHWPPAETTPGRAVVFVQIAHDANCRYGFAYSPGWTAPLGYWLAPHWRVYRWP